MDRERVAWIDYAKGFCIVMVVLMHSTLGVEKAVGETGWMHAVVAFTNPFRMPDFFMIAGLFLSRSIDSDWRDYLDRKVVHFGYFYLLWLAIEIAFKAPALAEGGVAGIAGTFLFALVEPFGAMWFIFVLPIFLVTVRLVRQFGLPWWLVWLAGAGLEIAHVHTGSTVIDEFSARFIYFYSGYLLAPHIFRLADLATRHGWLSALFLVAWAAVEAAAVVAGISAMPLVSLALGYAGAVAVVVLSTLLSRSDLMAPLRECGRQSLVIYLAFFLPMAATRIALLKSGLITDIGTISLIVTIVAVAFPVALERILRGTPGRYLFERPNWARLPARRSALVPAE